MHRHLKMETRELAALDPFTTLLGFFLRRTSALNKLITFEPWPGVGSPIVLIYTTAGQFKAGCMQQSAILFGKGPLSSDVKDYHRDESTPWVNGLFKQQNGQPRGQRSSSERTKALLPGSGPLEILRKKKKFLTHQCP